LVSLAGIVVVAAQHQHVAQLLGDRTIGGGVGRIGASFGDAKLLFGNLQRVLRSRAARKANGRAR
jgi:hypothetical protein